MEVLVFSLRLLELVEAQPPPPVNEQTSEENSKLHMLLKLVMVLRPVTLKTQDQ